MHHNHEEIMDALIAVWKYAIIFLPDNQKEHFMEEHPVLAEIEINN